MKWNALTKVLRYGGWGVLCSCQGVTNTGYQPQGEVSAKAQARKIIFIMTDTHRWDMLSSITPEIKTPNLDRLAEEGVRFDRALARASARTMCTSRTASRSTRLLSPSG